MPTNKNVVGSIYVLHFNQPYKHAKHYIGWTDLAVEDRLKRHRQGNGARLLQVLNENGIDYSLSGVYVGTKKDERRMKNQKHSNRFCSICKGNSHERR